MNSKTRLLLSAVFIILTMQLPFGGNAVARYMSDGATQNASGGWDVPTGGYYGGELASNTDCLRCHNTNSTSYTSAYANENNKETYLKTGHKNTLRKVQPQYGPASAVNTDGLPFYVFGYPWAGPDASGNLNAYTTDGTDFVNFSDASVTIVGSPYAGKRNLYWIYGGWISGLPGFFYGTDAYDSARTTFGTNNGYPCASCHSTGFQDDNNPGIAGTVWTPSEPTASFPGLSPVSSANPRWDQYGIQCSLCHNALSGSPGSVNSTIYPTQSGSNYPMGTLLLDYSDLRYYADRIGLCFGCHQSTVGTGVSSTPGVAGGDPALIPTGVGHGAGYGRDFSADVGGDVIGNSFLNSVHGKFNGPGTTGTGTMIKNPVGNYDLYDTATGKMALKSDYGSAFTSYRCLVLPPPALGISPLHSYSSNADGSRITTRAQCAKFYGGTWMTEPEGTCATCHDVHQSLYVPSTEGVEPDCTWDGYEILCNYAGGAQAIKVQCEDCHTAGGYQAAVGAPMVDVSRVQHPTGSGTPFDTTKYGNSCVVCHMATQAVINGDQVSTAVHLWRINPDPNYNTFPSMAQYYGGSCSVHSGTAVTNNSFVKAYDSDVSSDNCSTAGGTWTSVAQDRLATESPDVNDGYNNAVWVDLDLACGQCHGGSGGPGATHNGAPYFSKNELSMAAYDMHNNEKATICTNSSLKISVDPAGNSTATILDVTPAPVTCNNGDGTTIAIDCGTGGTNVGTTAGVTRCSYPATTTGSRVLITATATDNVTGVVVNIASRGYFVPANATAVTPTLQMSCAIGTTPGAQWTATCSDQSASAAGTTASVAINWGDGSLKSRGNAGTAATPATFTHTYTRQGTYTIAAYAFDGTMAHRTGNTNELTTTLSYYSISGTVETGAAAGAGPIANALVKVINPNGVIVYDGYTDAAGRFTTPANLKPKTYRIKVSAAGYTFDRPAATETLGLDVTGLIINAQ